MNSEGDSLPLNTPPVGAASSRDKVVGTLRVPSSALVGWVERVIQNPSLTSTISCANKWDHCRGIDYRNKKAEHYARRSGGNMVII